MTEQTYYVQSGKAKIKIVGKERALYVGEQKAIHVLNTTAYLIYEAMKDPIMFDELVDVIRNVTKGDIKTIRKDLKEAIDLFLRYEFIKIAE